MMSQDSERTSSLSTQITALQSKIATDGQNRNDIADRARYAADEKNRIAGALAFDVGGAGTPCRK